MSERFKVDTSLVNFRGEPVYRLYDTIGARYRADQFRFYDVAVERCAELNNRYKDTLQSSLPQPGDRGTYGTFPVTVIRQYDGNMFELLFPGGPSVVDISYFQKEQ